MQAVLYFLADGKQRERRYKWPGQESSPEDMFPVSPFFQQGPVCCFSLPPSNAIMIVLYQQIDPLIKEDLLGYNYLWKCYYRHTSDVLHWSPGIS